MTDEPPFPASVADGVRARDPDAVAAVFDALVGPLTAWLRSKVGDHHQAEDLAEETFLELVRGGPSITGGPYALRAWVYQAAWRNLLDHRRRWDRRPEHLTAEVPDHRTAALGPDDQAAGHDQREAMRALLNRLPPDQEQVLTLRFLGELTAGEVAVVLEKTEGAVRSLQHRGLAALGRLLREDPAGLDLVELTRRGGG